MSEVQDIVFKSRREHACISVSASRHASGGQQFGTHTVLLDMRSLNHLLDFDRERGIITLGAGIEWPELIHAYELVQTDDKSNWGIRQKQGGGDRMSLGGAISANAHGHGLGIGPIGADIESIQIVTADGEAVNCNRHENPELFRLTLGGYGLFGVITAVSLRLVQRQKVRRLVEGALVQGLIEMVAKREHAGALYGYFQYSIDETSSDFLRSGVLTTYTPAPVDSTVSPKAGDISNAQITELLVLAHRDRKAAFERYSSIELSQNGDVEWSDLHQLSNYPAHYHAEVSRRLGSQEEGADLIAEIYVVREELSGFLQQARTLLLEARVPLVYGTVRFIEPDSESFLAWAKRRYACVIFTMHTPIGRASVEKTAELTRQLAASAIRTGGSFYLTYQRFATRSELDGAYPQFKEFLQLKKKYDPDELFQSDWYRHYKSLYV